MLVQKHADLIERFKKKDRKALAKVITLVESTNIEEQKQLDQLLSALAKRETSTIRVAISGPPGVGKSTFINQLGQKILAQGFSLAVLPIDPSSEISHGSILADKTRMSDLLADERAYIRPSPAKGALGGMSFATHDVLFVTEAFGFDFIIVETVGVGQSETLARNLVDHFMVLVQPGSGDQLQAMKKGILERADFLVVSKNDGDQATLAKKTLASLRTLAHGEYPILCTVSALFDQGIDDLLKKLLERHQKISQSGELAQNRHSRLADLFIQICSQNVANQLRANEQFVARCKKIIQPIIANNGPIGPAATLIVIDTLQKL